MELQCCVQRYAWGKRGNSSVVAQLISGSEVIDNVSPTTHYAELWMGVHPNGASVIKKNNTALSEYLNENPDQLGNFILTRFGKTLPFLFKVLSVETALSIQAHPSKTHAEQLFKKYPDIYKDDNHKPEIAIALTEFEALCGFRERDRVVWAFETVPELTKLLGKSTIEDFLHGSKNIRPCFEALMKSNSESVKDAIASYLLNGEDSPEKDLAKKLNDQFPGDVGVLCVFWLNYLTLNPGEAIFLAPNEPHAYIFGDCVECMANSDNVVRAGLTPKLRDVETLCDMLTYKSYNPSDLLLMPQQEDEHTLLFNPPVDDFAVAQVRVPAGKTITLLPRASCSIIICISGDSSAVWKDETVVLRKGVTLFLPACHLLVLSATTEQTLYQAFCYEQA